MSFSTTENMELRLVVESNAMAHRTNRQRQYNVAVQTQAPRLGGPSFEAKADNLTLGEVLEVLAAIHHSRDGRGIAIPYVDHVVPLAE